MRRFTKYKRLSLTISLMLCACNPPPANKNIQSSKEIPSIAERERVATNIEKAWLERELDIRVSLEGPEKTTFRAYDRMLTRPVIYKLISDTETMNKFREKGFKRLIFTNDTESWTFEMDKPESWFESLRSPQNAPPRSN